MTNPFKIIAPAIFLRAIVFCTLGVMLLHRSIPTLFALNVTIPLPVMLIGLVLFASGVKDIFCGVKQSIKIRTAKLHYHPIDVFYTSGNGGNVVPQKMMTSGENPNEDVHPITLKWLSRIFPKVDFLPYPYTTILNSTIIALGLGVVGLLILLLIRIVLTDSPHMGLMLRWYYWTYILIGLIFWTIVRRYGFVRAQIFQGNLLPKGIMNWFISFLVSAAVVTYYLTTFRMNIPEPPNIPVLELIVWGGSIALIFISFGLSVLRSARSPEQYSVSQEEEYFSVGIHPTDLTNAIKTYTRHGTHLLFGSWKPIFSEHRTVQAGDFEADLNAESDIHLGTTTLSKGERIFGVTISYLGIALTIAGGFFFWDTASSPMGENWMIVTNSFMIPIALIIFGSVLYRIGIIPLSEVEWDSILFYCHVEGSFQNQGSMVLIQASDHRTTGSVLTNATVRVYCAKANTVGFFVPLYANYKVPRQIHRIDRADHIASELHSMIKQRADQSIGTPPPRSLPRQTPNP